MSAPDSDPTARPTAVAPDVVAARAIPLIDLTDLADDHSVAGIDLLCDRAAASGVAAVCVWPEHVARCVDRLGPGSPVRVATVVNFPAGTSPVDDVVVETSRAIADGADEIDVVLPYRRLLDGDEDGAVAMLGAIRAVCTVAAGRHDPTAREVHLKVILETGELGDLGVVARAAELAIAAGADFVKTSTGKTATGATPDAVRTMLQVIAASSRASASNRPGAFARPPTPLRCWRSPTRSWVPGGRHRRRSASARRRCSTTSKPHATRPTDRRGELGDSSQRPDVADRYSPIQ